VSTPLSPLDATFLELEDADTTAHMHIGAVLVFDPLPGGGTPTLARVRRHLERRLDALPRYRQRLSRRATGGLSWPQWEPDERFDIKVHVTRASLPRPGNERRLLEWAADFWSHRLDRGRPLWRVVLLEGLAGGRWALVTKTHHCLVDGVGSVDAGLVLLDAEPSPGRWKAPAPARVGSQTTAPNAMRRLAGLPIAAAEAAVDAVRHPRRAAQGLDAARALVELLVRDELVAAPRSSVNVQLSEHRRLAVAEIPLADIKAIKRALGGTVNDVILSLVTAGLRDLLVARDETPPAAGLRAMVPVNIRDAAEHLELGNRITSLFVHLPVSVEEPRARYRRVRAETMRLKASHQAAGGAPARRPRRARPAGAPQRRRAVPVRDAPVQRDGHQRPGVADDALRVRRPAAAGDPARAAGGRARRRRRRAVLRRHDLLLRARRPRRRAGCRSRRRGNRKRARGARRGGRRRRRRRRA
jgi:diacylglycerol O-acyltransferase